MPFRNSAHRYAATLIAAHWLTLALLVVVYACIQIADAFPEHSAGRAYWESWHQAAGISTFALVALRLALRALAGPSPAVQPALPAWQRRAASAMHVALYLFLVAMPLLGWLALAADGEAVTWLGWSLPLPIGENHALAHALEETHEAIGEAGYWLVGVHAAAALLHHYLLGDDTLRRIGWIEWRRAPRT